MYITYFDEVKYQKGVQPFYWLGGIMVDARLVAALETQVNELSKECYGTALLEGNTEFRAKDIFHGKCNFKGWDPIKRIEVLQRLIKIIDRPDEIYKILIRLEPARMLASDPEHKAFMFFVEQVEAQLRHLSAIGMLVGADKRFLVSASIRELSRDHEDGREFQFEQPIDRLSDTVRFTHSHQSRMLQLADVYIYAQQMCALYDKSKSATRTQFTNFVRRTKLLVPHRYKIWPPRPSLYV